MKMLKTMLLIFLSALVVVSCFKEEDPGPLQYDQRSYSMLDFDRIEMGDAFVIVVQQGPIYGVTSEGDRRNLDDLQVTKSGSTLKIGYDKTRQRDHTTTITISMPTLVGANLSGSVNSAISGFKNVSTMDLSLSGSSICQLNMEVNKLSINLSGSSKITLSGISGSLNVKVSGASELHAYDMIASGVDADASGSSSLNVFASQTLKANATGSSVIYYRGNPVVTSSSSGSSTIQQD